MGSNTCPGAWYWLRPHTAALRARPHSVLTLLSLQPLPGQQQEPALLKALGGRQARAPRAGGRGWRPQASGARPGTSEPASSSSFICKSRTHSAAARPTWAPWVSTGQCRPSREPQHIWCRWGCGATLNSGPTRAHHNPRLLSPRGRGVTHEFWGTDKTDFQLHERCCSTQR